MIKNQYEIYDNLPRLLKHYSLENKMQYCFLNSMQAFSCYLEYDWEKLSNMVHPWELATFAMLAIISGEDRGAGCLKEKQIVDIINAIRDKADEKLEKYKGDTFIFHLMPFLGMQQFRDQEHFLPYLYRFQRLFDDNDEPVRLQSIFEEKYKCAYIDFAVSVRLLLSVLLCYQKLDKLLSSEVNDKIKKVLESYPLVYEALSLTREKYIDLSDQFSGKKRENLISCVCPSSIYPFLEINGDIFIPLPHLLIQSCTTALLYRITGDDEKINASIGKNCLEKYLRKIVEESAAYECVTGEQEYWKNHNRYLSSDVLAKSDEMVLLLENKFLRPRLSLHYLGENSLAYTVDRIADYIKQIYTVMCDYALYDPFSMSTWVRENLWCVLVLFEDPFITREQCMLKAAELIGIDRGSEEYGWLINHIRIMSLYDIEVFCLAGKSICKELHQSVMDGDDPFNINPPYIGKGNYVHKGALDFQTLLDSKVHEKAKELFRGAF